MPERPLVLDTHIWLWAITGDSNITSSIRQQINLALEKTRVLVPAICIWEIGMLWKKNRIQLQEPLRDWVESALEKSGFLLAPMNETIALESTILPGNFHNDPADCMIVATARLEKAVLVTKDSRILEYGRVGHVQTLQA